MESETEVSLCSQSSGVSDFSNEDVSFMELGSGNYGCSHYRRRCKIRAPCCNEIFDCRHCHNEAKNSLDIDLLDRHDLPRHEVVKVICSLCDTEQDVQQYCMNCGVSMGKYFCTICKFFDDDTSKNQFHCDECGICRTGGKENFFHCKKCECCYSKLMENRHHCLERPMHHNCPICFEYMFDTMKGITILRCGHTIHHKCVKEMGQHHRYSCPICSKSIVDMTHHWEKLDQVIASTPMPETYQSKMVWILCNDCGANSHVQFHIVGHKCQSCKSYNTRQIQGDPTALCTSRVTEIER